MHLLETLIMVLSTYKAESISYILIASLENGQSILRKVIQQTCYRYLREGSFDMSLYVVGYLSVVFLYSALVCLRNTVLWMYTPSVRLLSTLGLTRLCVRTKSRRSYVHKKPGCLPIASCIASFKAVFQLESSHIGSGLKAYVSLVLLWKWSYTSFSQSDKNIFYARYQKAMIIVCCGVTSKTSFIFRLSKHVYIL